MDIASIIKKLDISLIKVAMLRIFNKSGLYDYVVDKANTAINMLLAAKATEVAAIRYRLAQLVDLLVEYSEYIPTPWQPYTKCINSLLMYIYAATYDNQIVADETKEIITQAKLAYAEFKSED